MKKWYIIGIVTLIGWISPADASFKLSVVQVRQYATFEEFRTAVYKHSQEGFDVQQFTHTCDATDNTHFYTVIFKKIK